MEWMERMTRMAANQVEIHRFNPAHIESGFAEALFHVADTGFQTQSPWTVKQIQDTLDTESSLLHYATIAGTVVGFIMASVTLDMVDVFIVVVSEEYKKRSIGTKLFEALIDYCHKNDIAEIILETRITNTPAIGLYERVGFQQIGLRKAYYSSPIEDAILMKKEIGEEINDC